MKSTNMTRLHLGCGGVHKPGFVNINLEKTRATDMLGDMRDLFRFADGTVELIENYHVVEHVTGSEVPAMLKEWLRVLRPGGRLVIECPDIAGCFETCKERNWEGDCLILIFGVYRPQPGGNHLWGWTRHTLEAVLREAGFVNIQQKPAQDYHIQYEGLVCLRIEAEKPR